MGVGNKKKRLFETMVLMAMRANLKPFLNENFQKKYVKLAQRVLLRDVHGSRKKYRM